MWTQWFSRGVWLVAVYIVGLAAYESWRALAQGTAVLRLDDLSPRAGGWLSGTLELSKLPRKNFTLHFECIKSSKDVGGSKNIRTVLWQAIAIIDRGRIAEENGGSVIPFAFRIPADAHPALSSEDIDVDWTIRVEAGTYVQEFEVDVRAADAGATAVPERSTPPRMTPELPASSLADLATEDGGATIVLPFPFVSLSLTLLFLGIAMAIALNRAGGSANEVASGLVVIGGFLAMAAFMLLVVAMTPRRVEIGEEVRITRGVLGLGFHSRLPRADVVKVAETLPVDATSTAFYGVQLHTRDGRIHVAATRLRDAGRARGVAAAIKRALNI